MKNPKVQYNLDRNPSHYIDRMKPLMKFFWYSGAVKAYYNGDGTRFIWRWWHPLSWIVIPILVVLSVVFFGIFETWEERDGLGLAIAPYFKKNPEKLEWINRK